MLRFYENTRTKIFFCGHTDLTEVAFVTHTVCRIVWVTKGISLMSDNEMFI